MPFIVYGDFFFSFALFKTVIEYFIVLLLHHIIICNYNQKCNSANLKQIEMCQIYLNWFSFIILLLLYNDISLVCKLDLKFRWHPFLQNIVFFMVLITNKIIDIINNDIRNIYHMISFLYQKFDLLNINRQKFIYIKL